VDQRYIARTNGKNMDDIFKRQVSILTTLGSLYGALVNLNVTVGSNHLQWRYLSF
jgi:hypothetical protein